ncbi:hypothetical protein [Aquibacillus rhizosphaerae]|uniref:Uncharacterized protein n=1 Tax=Aquibacillus rhizosphaerae TaxID=3051431 RepID=A0ABT7KZS0_9BACI|nr:hypothetical protein [Aquibacillus sp. LR5S19]MDL4838980.1 hypothetical protein [Aquibacillus sp. LR5S19]
MKKFMLLIISFTIFMLLVACNTETNQKNEKSENGESTNVIENTDDIKGISFDIDTPTFIHKRDFHEKGLNVTVHSAGYVDGRIDGIFEYSSLAVSSATGHYMFDVELENSSNEEVYFGGFTLYEQEMNPEDDLDGWIRSTDVYRSIASDYASDKDIKEFFNKYKINVQNYYEQGISVQPGETIRGMWSVTSKTGFNDSMETIYVYPNDFPDDILRFKLTPTDNEWNFSDIDYKD